MERKAVSGIMLSLLVIGMLTLAFNTQPIDATSLGVHNIDANKDFAAIDEMVLEWYLTYDFSPEADIPTGVANDSNDNIIVVGLEATSSIGSKWRIMKFASDGTLLYQRNDLDFSIYLDVPEAVAVDSSDNIIVVGWETDPTTRQALWRVMKFDPTLTTILWEYTNDFPPASGDNFADKAIDVAVDNSDKSMIVVGYDQEKGNGKAQWRVIKFDNDASSPTYGTELWSKSFDPNPDRSDKTYGAAIQSNGDIIVVGSDYGSATKADWGLKKLDSATGDVISTCDIRIPLTDGYDIPLDVAVDLYDNIIVVGYESQREVTGEPYDYRWRVIKFNPDCTESWSWAPSPDWSTHVDRAVSVAVDSKNNIIVLGYDREDAPDVKWRIMKFASDGTLLWTGFVNPLVGDSWELPHGITTLEGVNIVVVGSDDSPTRDYDSQWRIVKFAYTYAREIQNLIETIKTWDLRKGTDKKLTTKLKGALRHLDKGKESTAIRKLMGFVKKVEAIRDKKLTNEQAGYLTSEAQRIINLIKE